MFTYNLISKILFVSVYDLKDTINLYNLSKDHQNNIRITNLYIIPKNI